VEYDALEESVPEVLRGWDGAIVVVMSCLCEKRTRRQGKKRQEGSSQSSRTHLIGHHPWSHSSRDSVSNERRKEIGVREEQD